MSAMTAAMLPSVEGNIGVVGGQNHLLDDKRLFQQIAGLGVFLLIGHIHTKVAEAGGIVGMRRANRVHVDLHRLAVKPLCLAVPPLIPHHTRKVVELSSILAAFVAKLGFC